MGYSDRTKLRLWVRLDVNGDVIPGSEQYRPMGITPKNGNWKMINGSYCCGTGNTIIIFRNTTASANITSIVSADNAINWSGTLANNGIIAFVIPNGYDERITVITSTYSGRTFTTSVSQQNVEGTAAIAPPTSSPYSLTGLTTAITTNVAPGAQFLVILS
jgi:hypothetical protein